MKKLLFIAVFALCAGALGGVLAASVLNAPPEKTKEKLIAEFYDIENAVHVSPHSLRRKMDQGVSDYTLVDLRSAEEYRREHIIGAVNIPAYKNANTPAYEEVERIVGAFKALPKDKQVIVYCYSTACMTGRKIGKMLAKDGIYVQHLGIGWNEWRYFWTTWNHEHEWKTTKPEEYVISGDEPGKAPARELPPSCGTGAFAC